MRKQKWKTYAFWIILSEAVGILSGFLSREGMELYKAFVKKPTLSPPDMVFPIVWTVLFALMGTGVARIWLSRRSRERMVSTALFLVQLAVNFVWTMVFFNMQSFGLSLLIIIVLWALILLMILSFWRTDRSAAIMQIPYLLWVSFAIYLNAAVWLLNG